MEFKKYEEWMNKSGWKRGQGLGRNEDGLTKAIHIDKKNNTLGVGSTGFKHDNTWWDRVWENKTIGTNDQSDIFETRETFSNGQEKRKETDNKEFESLRDEMLKRANENGKNKDLKFGTFKKATMLLTSELEEEYAEMKRTEEKEKEKEKKEKEEKVQPETANKVKEKLKEEFDACKNRTLRKYAPIGKLERLKAQDEGRFDISTLGGEGYKKYEEDKNKIKEEQKSHKKLKINHNSENDSIKIYKQDEEKEEERENKKEKRDKKEKKEKKERKDKKDKKDKKEKSKDKSSSKEEKSDKKDKKDKKEKSKDKKDKSSSKEEKSDKKEKKEKSKEGAKEEKKEKKDKKDKKDKSDKSKDKIEEEKTDKKEKKEKKEKKKDKKKN
ncbi:hypothetical protein DICPUDRAFT_89341 [Dictyostelium purpureum]|uniref:G-patch domain-containing protein n=1 Tax=Dictyostelium purpureum TaxID=5786 RepID=F0ZVA5_DICPU|nr:uncharacterized protein DICPUDRAFT_89341 [Dictyostelium purpureum]EGC32134.1 hypothetical protein DICPUDRAFT_89341 [Dictyostelium purpureum]|eukprot:XP_003291343.1 hypothetical protein DICPUDRAFT_89341 [Dictyostelium purpureum]